jgi:hypothetical protein
MGSMAAMASMLSSLGGPMNVGSMFPPSGPGGFNAAQFLQQMEMAALGMNSPYMQNPFLQNLSALLYSNPTGPPQWGGQLSNKAVASMWMNSGANPRHHQEEEEVKF